MMAKILASSFNTGPACYFLVETFQATTHYRTIMAVGSTTPQLRRVPNSTSAKDILKIVNEDGGVIIQNFLTPDQIQRFNTEVQPHLDKKAAGSTHTDEFIADFHGNQTKRLTNLVTHSETFRNEILDHDLAHDLAEEVFRKESGSYWMTTAQVIEIGPGNKPQILHRDLENNPPFVPMGPKGPEALVNFLVAFTNFTEQNGATRVIPGSNHWPDFVDRGSPEMTIPAEMSAGDALFISGKTVHGGGSNQSDMYRRAVAFTFQAGYLTPEEAYPFLVDMKVAKTMSKRAQQMIGFRSQYPKGSPGLWQTDYEELGDFLGL